MFKICTLTNSFWKNDKMTSKIYILLISIFVLVGCGKKQDDNRTEFFPKIEQKPNVISSKQNVWVYILADNQIWQDVGKLNLLIRYQIPGF